MLHVQSYKNYNPTRKSDLIPQKVCTFLGFRFDTHNMCISIPQEKQIRVLTLLNQFKVGKRYSIRMLAHLIGMLVSICPATKYGWLHTKELEIFKTKSLSINQNRYDAKFVLLRTLLNELEWWKHAALDAKMVLKTDVF